MDGEVTEAAEVVHHTLALRPLLLTKDIPSLKAEVALMDEEALRGALAAAVLAIKGQIIAKKKRAKG